MNWIQVYLVIGLGIVNILLILPVTDDMTIKALVFVMFFWPLLIIMTVLLVVSLLCIGCTKIPAIVKWFKLKDDKWRTKHGYILPKIKHRGKAPYAGYETTHG